MDGISDLGQLSLAGGIQRAAKGKTEKYGRGTPGNYHIFLVSIRQFLYSIAKVINFKTAQPQNSFVFIVYI